MPSLESLDRLRHESTPLAGTLALELAPHPAQPTSPPQQDPSTEEAPRRYICDSDLPAERRLAQSQKMEVMSRLTGGIAHCFNNLMSGLIGSCDLLDVAVGDESSDAELLHKIQISAHQCGQLVQQLMAFSQQQVLRSRSINLTDLISELAPSLEHDIGRPRDIEWELELEPRLWSVRADSEQLEQAIRALTVNASEAMPAGGRLVLRARNLDLGRASIDHLGLRKGQYVLVEVEDSGHGISEEIYEHIFEPFFSTRDKSGSRGLGLSTVYGTVLQSGGEIRVDSQPGRGSRFTLYLPRERSVAVAPPSSVRRQLAKPQRSTILVAEDDPTVQFVLETLLRQRDYEVLLASDGVEGLALSRAHAGKIDLLLTDIVMPKKDGLELARQVTQERPGICVLFISGYSQDLDALQDLLGKRDGIDFLRKPFDNHCLEHRLDLLLEGVHRDPIVGHQSLPARQAAVL